jgi:hypothetical protein
MEEARLFQTPDIYLSSGLTILLETEPSFIVVNGRTLFCFSATDKLYKAMALYNAGVPINAIEFAGVIKRLRGEAINRRIHG